MEVELVIGGRTLVDRRGAAGSTATGPAAAGQPALARAADPESGLAIPCPTAYAPPSGASNLARRTWLRLSRQPAWPSAGWSVEAAVVPGPLVAVAVMSALARRAGPGKLRPVNRTAGGGHDHGQHPPLARWVR